MKKLTKKEVVLIIMFLIAVIFFNIKEFVFKTNEKLIIQEEVNENESEEEDENIESNLEDSEEELTEPKEIEVDICGAVENPGVVILKEGDRVIDAIEKAGGLTEKADIVRINRSKYVYDSEKIIIPEIGQEIDNEANQNTNNLGIDNKININIAAKEELMNLNGIGEALSERIIKYRQKNNGFKNIEDIMNVSGIGQSKFEQIKDSIKVK